MSNIELIFCMNPLDTHETIHKDLYSWTLGSCLIHTFKCTHSTSVPLYFHPCCLKQQSTAYTNYSLLQRVCLVLLVFFHHKQCWNFKSELKRQYFFKFSKTRGAVGGRRKGQRTGRVLVFSQIFELQKFEKSLVFCLTISLMYSCSSTGNSVFLLMHLLCYFSCFLALLFKNTISV